MNFRLFALLLLLASDITMAAPLAPTPMFRNLGVDEGLPSSNVYKLAIDHEGYIWAGTADGLARYDGVGFRVWRHDPADTDTPAGNEIAALLVDRENRLWLGGDGFGLDMLDAARRRFRHFRPDPSNPASLPAADIWALAQDTAGAIWIGTYSAGLVRFDPMSGRFERLRHDPANPSTLVADTVLSLLATRDGALWIGTEQGLDRRDANGSFQHVALTGDASQVTSLTLDADSVIAGTDRGLQRVGADLSSTPLTASSASAPLVAYAAARDVEGGLWFATRNGLHRRLQDGTLRRFGHQSILPGSLMGNGLFDVLADHEGGLWIAVMGRGLAYLPPQWKNFHHFRSVPGDENSLSGNPPTALAQGRDGALWVVNAIGGVDRIDPAEPVVQRLGSAFAATVPPLWSVLEDRVGCVWLGMQRGLRVHNVEGKLLHDFSAMMPIGAVDLLVEAPDGAVWASAHGGGLVRIGADRDLRRFAPGDAGAPRSADVAQLVVDAAGRLWVAHALGLDLCSPECTAVEGVHDGRVQAIAIAGDTFWLARFGALERYRLDGGRAILLERFGAAAEWPAFDVGGLALDRAGGLWATSPRGLFHFDPIARAVRRYDSRDGLLSPEFVPRSLHASPAGHLFAATQRGVVGFDPAALTDGPRPPSPLLIAADVQRGRERALLGAEAVLGWRDLDLRVDFRALSYAAAPRYQLRLDGLDNDWVDAGERGQREFGQLAPGHYRLFARAANANGAWSVPVAPLTITVEAPPWQQPWAYLVYVMVLAGGLTFAARTWRGRVSRRHAYALAQQRQTLAEQASAAKSDFLAHMGHEIRTPMTGVLGMSELLLHSPLDANQRSYAEAIAGSGRHMMRLLDDALDLARIEAGQLVLEDEVFNPAALLHEVAGMVRALAERKAIDLSESVATVPGHVRGDVRRVRQVLLNLAGNAVKFTQYGGVSLRLSCSDDGALIYAVRDSGPGLSVEQRERLFRRFAQTEHGRRTGGSGLGLAISAELIALMGGRIELDSMPGEGSEFRAVLPLAEANAVPELAEPVATDSSCVLDLVLVEDDTTVAAAVRGLLELLGHRVRHAPQALAAIVEFDLARPDAAFLDLDLPGIDGLQLARLIRQREIAPTRLPLIALTARSGADAEAQALAAGFDVFLRKPVTTARLAAVLAPYTASPARC